MWWIIGIILVFLTGTITCVGIIFKNIRVHRSQLINNQKYIFQELELKKKTAKDIFDLLLGLSESSHVEEKEQEASLFEESLKTNLGKQAIAKAEMESLYVRIRELDEVQQEIEASSLESEHELNMLKSQEKVLADKNAEIKKELERSLTQIDELLIQLAGSQVAVEQLTKTKTQMLSAQEKTAWYEQEISELNRNYMDLKKAYDALDIEYAQLYEKQNM